MPMVSAQQAARRLNINVQRVRALAAQGRLRGEKIANRWLFDPELLADEEKRRRPEGRPYAPLHAMGILFLASGESAQWLSRYEAWRIHRYAIPRLKQLGSRLRGRASVRSYRAPEAIVARLLR